MIPSILTRLRGEDGVSLTELMVSTLVSVLTLAILLSWVSVMDRQEGFQADDFEALNEIRFAKAEMVKEFRFADGILTLTGDVAEVWVDHDLDGTIGTGGSGERVTWAITPTGTLVRFEDGDASGAVVKAEHIMTAESSFAQNGDIIHITLVADVDMSGGPSARTISTQVAVRNT